MADHPNAARFRAMSDAMSSGELDPASLADGLADDVEWWEIGMTGPVRGKQAVMERLQVWEKFNIAFDLHDVVANDEHMIALANATATKGDETFHYRVAEIYHIDPEGRVAARWAFSDDTAAIVAFFGQPG